VSALLDRRVALVTGGDTGFGQQVAFGLADQGAVVGVVEPSALESRDRAGAAFAAVAEELGPIDVVVHAALDVTAAPSPVADLDEGEWDARCEAQLRATLWCCQAAFEVLRDRGGRLVLITPSVSLTGAAGLVPLTTAVEGMRAMAKSAARQWAGHGITANCVAPSLEAMVPDAAPAGITPPVLGRPPDARGDVAPVIALVAAGAAHFVTGTTIVVDGGAVMLP